MPRQPRTAAKSSSQRIYRVIKPKEFHDHRDAYNGPLSFTRPTNLDLKELKVLAISSRNLLDAWKKRHSEGAEHPLKNGFKIQPEHRLEHQAVFRLSVDEQKRLVRNRSFCFWECLNMTNGYDARILVGTIKRIVDPDKYYGGKTREFTIFPPSKYDQERFLRDIEADPHWKRTFLTLHQMMKWLKSIIFLHMFSPQFDFRFCEMRYEFSPFNSWNPLPVDPQSQSSLYQTNIQFQKLSDFILIADQIRALERVLSWETTNWCRTIELQHLPKSLNDSSDHESWPMSEKKHLYYSLLHEQLPEIQMENKDAEFRILGFDTHIAMPSTIERKPLSVLRLLSLINAGSSEHRKAVVLNFVLDPATQRLKNLICRSEIPAEHIDQFIQNTIAVEANHSKIIVVDKYIVLFEELDINFTRNDKNGKRRLTQKGPSLTIWDREGNFKECKRSSSDFATGFFYLKRLPGRRFALIQKTAFGEAKSLIYNLEYREPILYNGEIGDSNMNYFTIRLADHVQFYTFNNKTDKEAEYLFSIRSLLDERVTLCSGGSDRFATSRISLPYHIQVYNFLPRKTAKLNSKLTSQNMPIKKKGQHEELSECLEKLSYPKPEVTMTRPFKQSQSDCSNDDTRLRILATVAGCWQLSDKISENNPPLPNPGENFSLIPSGILIHDSNHDLLCFQPLKADKDSKTATSHGRMLLSLPHQTNTETNEHEYFLPVGKCWGRLVGNEMYFYSQSILNGTLAQHKISFGPPKARGAISTKNESTKVGPNGTRVGPRVRWRDQETDGSQSLVEAFDFLQLDDNLL